jgi:glycosidase
MTYPGAPCIYYGDEIGLQNGPTRIPEDCRYAFPWSAETWNHDLLDHYKRCIKLRRDYPSLRTGDFKVLYAEGNQIVYTRTLAGQSMLVALNNGDRTEKFQVQTDVEAPIARNGLISGVQATVEGQGILSFTLGSHSGEVFRLT